MVCFAKFDNWYREEGPGLGFCFCFEILSLRYPHVVEVETSCRQMDTCFCGPSDYLHTHEYNRMLWPNSALALGNTNPLKTDLKFMNLV